MHCLSLFVLGPNMYQALAKVDSNQEWSGLNMAWWWRKDGPIWNFEDLAHFVGLGFVANLYLGLNSSVQCKKRSKNLIVTFESI